MTKKDYQSVATAFGQVLKDIDPTLTVAQYDKVMTAVWDTIDAFMAVALDDNPRFDRQRFIDWVVDTQRGARTLAGKKVA